VYSTFFFPLFPFSTDFFFAPKAPTVSRPFGWQSILFLLAGPLFSPHTFQKGALFARRGCEIVFLRCWNVLLGWVSTWVPLRSSSGRGSFSGATKAGGIFLTSFGPFFLRGPVSSIRFLETFLPFSFIFAVFLPCAGFGFVPSVALTGLCGFFHSHLTTPLLFLRFALECVAADSRRAYLPLGT